MNDKVIETSDVESQRGRILVVDDEPNIRSMLRMVLAGQGYTVELAAEGDSADTMLAESLPDLILLDVRLPGRSGLDLLKQWYVQFPRIPIILMSGDATISEAIEGLKIGAYDFIEKPFLTPKLLNIVNRALQLVEQSQRNQSQTAMTEHLIGSSPLLVKTLDEISKIAKTKTRVLITGESGSGKDLIARAIHQQSSRSSKMFVKVNCAAIPSELIESQLFGHVRGAFTGALTARRGLFETANGGTLFLDEVGELSLSAQAKMLRALQSGEIAPVGSDKTITVDVRIIAATNRDLKQEVELGNFREDLFYRLNVVTLFSPPLRERSEDIPLLCQYFIKQICNEYALPQKQISTGVTAALSSYPWPGNIRELRNVLERMLILSGPILQVGDLPLELQATPKVQPQVQSFQPATWEEFKLNSERDFLISSLKHCAGNISETARILGVERSTIHKWIKSYQIGKHHYLD